MFTGRLLSRDRHTSESSESSGSHSHVSSHDNTADLTPCNASPSLGNLLETFAVSRALQWSGNPYGNGYGVEMDGNGAQFVKILWIGLDLGQTVDLKRYDRYRTFTKHDISNTDTRLYLKRIHR